MLIFSTDIDPELLVCFFSDFMILDLCFKISEGIFIDLVLYPKTSSRFCTYVCLCIASSYINW